ncbi:MAG: alpha/beta hydrolase [Candidatus Lokiarchaeota archaeon]|nr:alpha/beta hydrolase [Candidatus Lokiarchaeota archaeon]
MEWIDDIEEKCIETNGITLHTIIIGEGEPLVLLHGFPDFWYGWKNLIPLIKDKYQLIIPDMRGYNLSDKPEGVEKYRIELLIEDIIGLIEQLNFESVYLVGHDWGGVLSWFITEKYPNRIRKLGIINGPHLKIFQERLKSDEDQKKASYYMFKFQEPNGENFLIENEFKLLRMGIPKEDEDKYIKAWSNGTITCGVNYYRANLDYSDWSGIILVPTLVIHGMKDRAILPGVLDGLEDYVKDLKILRSEHLGHSAMKEDPKLVAKTFKDFFN